MTNKTTLIKYNKHLTIDNVYQKPHKRFLYDNKWVDVYEFNDATFLITSARDNSWLQKLIRTITHKTNN